MIRRSQSVAALVAAISNDQNAYASQASWTIDPVNGNDANAGSVGAPIKTATEWQRRIAGAPIKIAMTVHCLSALGATDNPHLVIDCSYPGSSCIWTMDPAAATITSTITARTSVSRATNVPTDITDGAQANAFWTTHLQTDRRIRFTVSGAVAWLLKDIGTKKGRITIPYVISSAVAAYNYTPTVLAGNEAYVIEILGSATSITADVLVHEDFSFIPKVQFVGFRFVNRCTFRSNAIGGTSACGFINCSMGVPNLEGGWSTSNCLFGAIGGADDGYPMFTSQATYLECFAGGMLNGSFNYFSGSCVLDMGFTVQKTTYGNGIQVFGASGGNISDCASFDSLTNGITFFNPSGVTPAPYFGSLALWGSGNAAYGCKVDGGVMVPFQSFAGMTIAGATAAVAVGVAPVTKTWAQVVTDGGVIESDIATGVGKKFSGVTLQ